ncbi:hypothetical protein J7K93_03035 [bacterium]|nr:hypothetical protein [bacterium]
MFRFIFTALIVYFGYRYLKNVWKRTSQPANVRGKKKSRPMDFDDQKIVDAKFEDIDEEEKDS